MQSGTAIGILVGGAVLILAASPRPQALAAPGGGTYPLQPAPGGALNPFNWFSGAMQQPQQQQQQPQQQQQQLPQAQAMPAGSGYNGQSPRMENASYSPSQSPYQSASQSPYNQQAYSPMGSPAYGSPSFQQASYSPSYYTPQNNNNQYASNNTGYGSPSYSYA